MAISDNILAVQTRIENDADFAADLRQQAIDALYVGLGTEQWNKYMNNFVDTPATAATPTQLARLTTTAGDDQIAYQKEARAYLLGNAVCVPGTRTGLAQGIGLLLD